MLPKFQVATACFSCSPPNVNSSKSLLAVGPGNYLTFQITPKFSNEKIKILFSLSHAFAARHPNVFTQILSLLEGRVGITWESCNNKK
jgi:hypothetical protein